MSLHVFPEVVQRSEEWYDQRRGLVTASAVGSLLTVGAPGAIDYDCPACDALVLEPCLSLTRKTPTPLKYAHESRTALAAMRAKSAPPVIEVADNETSRNLTKTLVAERVAGWTEDLPMTSDMWRGVEHEPFARDIYAANYGAVTEVGFMLREEDGWQLGYSPDGLVGEDGLIEIKCPRAKTHLNTILADEVPTQYMPQLQAGLLVSGRDWIDFVSFVAGMPLYRKRVYPDPLWAVAIKDACLVFEETAARIVADYRKRVVGMPKTDRLAFDTVELKLA